MSVQALWKERGDLNRQQRFLAAHAATHDRIYGYFRRRTDGPATAEDLSSEVFKIVWEKWSRGTACRSWSFSELPKTFSPTTSVARAANLFGILRREREAAAPEAMESPIQEALGHLSPGDREVLQSRQVDSPLSTVARGRRRLKAANALSALGRAAATTVVAAKATPAGTRGVH
jgi:DNA-directed RNA polymerase specialized sigma24 family protein